MRSLLDESPLPHRSASALDGAVVPNKVGSWPLLNKELSPCRHQAALIVAGVAPNKVGA